MDVAGAGALARTLSEERSVWVSSLETGPRSREVGLWGCARGVIREGRDMLLL